MIFWSHRGFPGVENSLSAFNHACSHAITHFETDLHVTKDQVLVLAHDPTIGRVARGTHAISEITLKELQNFPIQQAEPWCTLDELVLAHPDVIISLDMKSEGTLAPLISWMNGRDTSNYIVGSFSHKRVVAFRKAHPHIQTALTTKEVLLIRLGLSAGVSTNLFAPKYAMVPPKIGPFRLLTQGFVKRCRKMNISIHAWTINSKEEFVALKDLGITGVITDDFRILRND